MDYSLNVLHHETNYKENVSSDTLRKKLGLPEDPNNQGKSVLAELIKS